MDVKNLQVVSNKKPKSKINYGTLTTLGGAFTMAENVYLLRDMTGNHVERGEDMQRDQTWIHSCCIWCSTD